MHGGRTAEADTAFGSLARGQRPATHAERVVRWGGALPPWASATLLAVGLAALWLVVYATGGTHNAAPHLFYLPIILATLPFGLRGALAVAVVAAVLTGPLMPLDTGTGEAQPVGSWLIRGAMFAVVGGAASVSLMLRERLYTLRLTEDVGMALIGAASTPGVEEGLVARVAETLDRRAFRPVFQPIYSLDDGHLVAVEALTRFDEDDRPPHGPDQWFAAATHAGLAVQLELAAIEVALDAAAALDPTVLLSVNASPATLADPRLLALAHQHRRLRLTVEITEHQVVTDYPRLFEQLTELRACGAQIAVDDAGAGFASLRHIVQLAPDIIKLDMSLTQDVGSSPLRRALATALIEFSDRTGALLVVEGIESPADLTMWTALGAHAVQGYLVGRPGPLPPPAVSPHVAALRGAR